MSRRSAVKANQYVLYWAGDGPKTVTGLNSQSFVVPPHNIAVERPGGIYRCASARNDKGEPIPGTILLRDEQGTTGDGGHVLSLDARAWVEMLEVNQPDLFTSGFEAFESWESVEENRAACREYYESARDAAAELVIRNELARVESYKTKGQPPPPPANAAEVTWAVELKRARRNAQAVQGPTQAEMLEALGDNVLPTDTPLASAVSDPPAPRRGPGRPRKTA